VLNITFRPNCTDLRVLYRSLVDVDLRWFYGTKCK